MGGLGSGGWNRSGRGTVEAYRSLSVGRLRDAGALRPGWRGRWSWTSGGDDGGSIGLEGGRHRLRLSWRSRTADGPWRDVEQAVAIRWRTCPFGGERPFLVCPACDQDRLRLHLGDGSFRCRCCLGLVHGSRRERERDRLLRRTSRLRVRLGDQPGLNRPVPARPRHMRHRTYARLAAELQDLDMAVADELVRMLLRCEGRIPGRAGGFWRWA